MTPADAGELQRALTASNAGDQQTAEPMLRRLVAKYPQNENANEALGLIYAEEGSLKKALPYLQRACKSAPNSALDHANLGAAWLKLGRNRNAVNELKLAASLDPGNGSTLSNLGQAYMLVQEPRLAARAFSAAARTDPHNADLLYNWAVALNQTNDLAAAEAVLKRISPEDMSDQAESLAGGIEERLGHYLAAVGHFQRAAEKDPSEANIYALCIEFMRHWTWSGAEKTATYGRKKYPDSTRMELALGAAFYGDQKYSDAAAIFADLLKRNPENDMYAQMLGHSCEISGNNAPCAMLETFSSQHPENASAAVYAAQQILHRPHNNQDLNHAEQLLVKATAEDPEFPEGWYELGVLQDEQKQWTLCARSLEKAVALRPDFPGAHYRLMQVYAHLGRKAESKRELALFQTYSQKDKKHLDQQFKAVTVFLTKSQ